MAGPAPDIVTTTRKAHDMRASNDRPGLLVAVSLAASIGALPAGAQTIQAPGSTTSVDDLPGLAERYVAATPPPGPIVPTRNDQTAVIGQTGTDNRAVAVQGRSEGSTVLQAQGGSGNLAQNLIIDSPSAVGIQIQLGNDNVVQGAILNSPNSLLLQGQIGGDLESTAAIVGGSNNRVVVPQNGAGFDRGVLLLESHGVTVTRPPEAADGTPPVYGGVLVINGKPGMRINLR